MSLKLFNRINWGLVFDLISCGLLVLALPLIAYVMIGL